MNAAKTGARNRIHSVEPRRRQLTLWTLGLTSEHFAIESNEPLPISGDKIGMHVFRADWHFTVSICDLHIGQAKNEARTYRISKALRANTSRLGVVLRNFGSAHTLPAGGRVLGSF